MERGEFLIYETGYELDPNLTFVKRDETVRGKLPETDLEVAVRVVDGLVHVILLDECLEFAERSPCLQTGVHAEDGAISRIPSRAEFDCVRAKMPREFNIQWAIKRVRVKRTKVKGRISTQYAPG